MVEVEHRAAEAEEAHEDQLATPRRRRLRRQSFVPWT